jgi:asparagine synthase (glutamine-hydrolysing)
MAEKSLLMDYALMPFIPDSAMKVWRALRREPQQPTSDLPFWAADRPINHPLMQRTGVVEAIKSYTHPEPVIYTKNRGRKEHWHDINSGMFTYILELLEKMTGAFGLEARHPFFDKRLIEFCLALPPHQRIRGGWTRAILRFGTDGILPPEIRWRGRKGNLSANLKVGFLRDNQEIIEKTIGGDTKYKRIEEYVDLAASRAAYERYKATPILKDDEAFSLFLVVALSSWLRDSVGHSQ